MGLDINIVVANRKNDMDFTQQDTVIHQQYYFRKVNCLIRWIERYVEDVDNRKEIELTKSHITQLHETLQQLTPENCNELMPTQNGFLFGTTVYGDLYWSNIHALKKMTQNLLLKTDWDKHIVVFWAWW